MQIPYNISDEELYQLLDLIDGVYFTGGNLNLYNQETNAWHRFYQTAKKIYQYAIETNENQVRRFPILGICQGFEILCMLAGGDDYSLLSSIYHFENRKTKWVNNQQNQNSVIYKSINTDLKKVLEEKNYALHLHKWSVYYESYQRSAGMRQQFKVLGIDQNEGPGTEFITIIEGRKYPFYGFMFHPEYQMMEFLNYEAFRQEQNKYTLDFTLKISQMLAKQTDNKIRKDSRALLKYELDSKNRKEYILIENSKVFAYGFQ